jgi:hypothetical protein
MTADYVHQGIRPRRWDTLTPVEKSRWAAWLAEACELFGASIGTSHDVASLFFNGMERGAVPPIDGSGT